MITSVVFTLAAKAYLALLHSATLEDSLMSKYCAFARLEEKARYAPLGQGQYKATQKK